VKVALLLPSSINAEGEQKKGHASEQEFRFWKIGMLKTVRLLAVFVSGSRPSNALIGSVATAWAAEPAAVATAFKQSGIHGRN
jgi:hypothetical protein